MLSIVEMQSENLALYSHKSIRFGLGSRPTIQNFSREHLFNASPVILFKILSYLNRDRILKDRFMQFTGL